MDLSKARVAVTGAGGFARLTACARLRGGGATVLAVARHVPAAAEGRLR